MLEHDASVFELMSDVKVKSEVDDSVNEDRVPSSTAISSSVASRASEK